MPIPPLEPSGLLPAGIHDCSLDEIQARFGVFRGSEARPRLFERLRDLITAMRRSGLFEAVLVDGSFVTRKAVPNDMDLLAVLSRGHDFERDLPISEYALVSRALLRRRFGFDVVVAEKNGPVYETYVEFFSRVRDAPGLRKGILRISL